MRSAGPVAVRRRDRWRARGAVMAGDEIKVWDPAVRYGHWLIAIGFTIDYITDEPLPLHVWVGYVIGAVLALRIVWGLAGPRHARFADFLYRPSDVLAYLRDLIR